MSWLIFKIAFIALSIKNIPALVPPIEITIVVLLNSNFSLNSSLEKFVSLTIGPTLLILF